MWSVPKKVWVVCSLGKRHLSGWLSLFKTALNREVSASLASTFVDGAFGWINPERLSLFIRRSRRDLSFSSASPHQAGEAYIVLAMIVARVIS